MIFVVFLFLVSTVFAQKEECFRSWYYIENPTEQQEQQALNDGCFHGTYGPISLLSCEYEGSKFLTKMECSAKLCVIETPRPEELKEKLSILNSGDNRPTTTQLLEVEDRYVLTSDDGAYSCLDLELNRADTNIITVNEDAWRPISMPHRSVYNLTADPNIQAVINSVQPNRIQEYIQYLASEDIWTRQAQSDGAKLAADFLETTFSSLGFKVTRHPFRSGYSDNIIAELAGTDGTKEIVVVGAHYDSRGSNSGSTTQRAPGADDNASGTASLLELAQVIHEQSLSFKKTIRLACFSGEEQGLVGSRAYAKLISDRGDKVIAMFNGDMLGWKQTDLPITLGMMNRYVSAALTTAVNAITKDYVPSLPVGTTAGCCSDQQSFTEYGIPAVGYFENTAASVVYPHYHQSTDLPQYINVQQLGLEAKALMAAALTYAGATRGI